VAVEHVPNPVSPLVYFLCPGCGGRAYKLYAKQVRFQCRRCTGLRPAVDNLSTRERQSRRLEKINKRLTLPAGMPITAATRPGKMPWKTFEKLLPTKITLEAPGVRVRQWLFDKINAERRRRERDQEKPGPHIRNGLLYLD
jgi:hypothetical protein